MEDPPAKIVLLSDVDDKEINKVVEAAKSLTFRLGVETEALEAAEKSKAIAFNGAPAAHPQDLSTKRQLRQRPQPPPPKRQRQVVARSQQRKASKRGKKRHAQQPPPLKNLRRSERKRKPPQGLGFYATENGDDDDEEEYENLKGDSLGEEVEGQLESDGNGEQMENESEQAGSQEEAPVQDQEVRHQSKASLQVTEKPRREGLRPRRSTVVALDSKWEEDGEEHERANMSEDEVGEEEGEDEEGEDGAEREEGEEGEEEEEGEEDGEEEEEEEEEDEEEERREERRYALRNRTEVQRFSPRREERPARARSPRKMYGQGGNGKRGREGRRPSRAHKRHHSFRADDSDDSLLVDEMDAGPAGFWGRGTRPNDSQWLPPGIEVLGPAAWGGGPSASGWASQGEWLAGGKGQQGEGAAAAAGAGHSAGKLSGKAGADIQPVQVDTSVTFDQIGGLARYIDSLKEMVFFPLLYPQFFANYNITPPRGVLLCGPPGTGKTLVARALASTAARAGQKVTFFMRKGADVLSKWVGEAERQLKMLFEEAQRCQPSIIFFDEIDGLAPVRSSKQEQIHNSIVSTLLALMDGLDSRGQVVVIGATNRIDAIDGALRRPGRFDREFFFPLPDVKARADILQIHTRNWKDPPTPSLREELAQASVGYCGADMKALCTEAAIRAFRMKYPQVYQSDEQFLIDVDAIKVERRHFQEAMAAITPAAHRSAVVHARPLPVLLGPCLDRHLAAVLQQLRELFPPMAGEDSDDEEMVVEEEGDESGQRLARLFGSSLASSFPFVQRPRLLLCGKTGAGQDYLGPAILHELEQFPVHSLGLPSLLADASAKTPEEALVHIIGEARKNTPAVLFLPHLQLWWDTAHDQLRATLAMLLADLPASLPLLLLGTADVLAEDIDPEACSIFGRHVYTIAEPTSEEREQFFSPIMEAAVTVPQLRPKQKRNKAPLPELSKAPSVEKGPSEAELQLRAAEEEHALRRLRMCLRDVCNRLLHEKRFSMFHYPVMDDDAPDYEKVVQHPMDVSTLLQRVDMGAYLTRAAFLQDVELIPGNAKAYNGDDYHGARIVSKACALRDAVHGMLAQMDPALVAYCDEIAARGGPICPPLRKHEAAPSAGVTAAQAALAANQGPAGAAVTRASARLRGVQPVVDLSKTPEALLRQRRRTSEAGLQDGTSAGVPPGGAPVGAPSKLGRAGGTPERARPGRGPREPPQSYPPAEPANPAEATVSAGPRGAVEVGATGGEGEELAVGGAATAAAVEAGVGAGAGTVGGGGNNGLYGASNGSEEEGRAAKAEARSGGEPRPIRRPENGRIAGKGSLPREARPTAESERQGRDMASERQGVGNGCHKLTGQEAMMHAERGEVATEAERGAGESVGAAKAWDLNSPPECTANGTHDLLGNAAEQQVETHTVDSTYGKGAKRGPRGEAPEQGRLGEVDVGIEMRDQEPSCCSEKDGLREGEKGPGEGATPGRAGGAESPGMGVDREKEEAVREQYRQSAAAIKARIVRQTEGVQVEGLEIVNAALWRIIQRYRKTTDRWQVLQAMHEFVDGESLTRIDLNE